MLKRIFVSTLLGGVMLFGVPHAALADGRHGHDGRSEHHDGRDRDDHRSEHHDRGHDRDDYGRHYGYDDDYYGYYGSGCNGYRDGYYYDRDGRRYSSGNNPYYRRNADCDDYYNRYGRYYGSPYCDSYDYRTGYCS